MRRFTFICFVLIGVLLAANPRAADTWVEAHSPNFHVISNNGERSARDLAAQFEQIRAGIAQGWPWAQAPLDRPLLIVGVKDENTLKSFAPQYWETSRDPRLASVSASAWDRHYIVMRTDLRVDGGEGVNPYRSAYWTYCDLMLSSSFRFRLPLWFSRGMAAVLSNTNVTDREVQIGRVIPSYMQEMRGGRFQLAELLSFSRDAPELRDPILRRRFDAQSWSLVHFLVFGSADAQLGEGRVNGLAQLLISGTPSVQAVTQVYGPIDELDTAYRRYVDRGLTRYVTIKSDIRVSSRAYPVQPVAPAEALLVRAGFLAANNRGADARAVIAEARGLAPDAPGGHEVEGLLLEREQNREAARASYEKAIELGSQNFLAFTRLATLLARGPDTAQRRRDLLERSVALNDTYSMSHQMLASTLMEMNLFEDALVSGRRAVELSPTQLGSRLNVATILGRLGRKAEALAEAQVALALASTDSERAMVQRTLQMIERIR